MPTKHIDADQWQRIEDLAVDVTGQTNILIKDGEMLKKVIERGLSGLSTGEAAAWFGFKPRAGVVGEAVKGDTLLHFGLNLAGEEEVVAHLSSAEPCILCLFGKTNSGRTTLSERISSQLAELGCPVQVFDDAGDAECREAWQIYANGGRVIVVIRAADKEQASAIFYPFGGRMRAEFLDDARHFAKRQAWLDDKIHQLKEQLKEG